MNSKSSQQGAGLRFCALLRFLCRLRVDRAVCETADAEASVTSSPSVNTGSTASSTLLKKGSRGEAVKTMQTMLNAASYSCGSADGIFGNKTLSALKAFQKDHGLAVDGIYGEKSAAAHVIPVIRIDHQTVSTSSYLHIF